MENNRLDLKSLRSCGIHGAIGLLMGIGAGFILLFIISPIISANSSANYPFIMGAAGLVAVSVIYGLYGFYVGYIFSGQKKSSRISITYAAAGVIGGFVTVSLLAMGFFTTSKEYLDPLFVTLFFTGPILGFPKIKNIVLMTASSAFGAVMGHGVFTIGQNITIYLNSSGSVLFAWFIAILFPLLAIGIAGASIAIGMYFTEETIYTAREIPWYLKMARSAGIFLTILVLLSSSLMFLSIAKYASTDTSIDISSGDGRTTVLIPVILENGKVMEMYLKPTISGSAETEIIDTDHGKALKIRGSGALKINMKQTGGFLASDAKANEMFINGFTLSTSNATNYSSIGGRSAYAWVYSEEDGTMFSLSIRRDNGWGREMNISTEREENLTRGWQMVKISVGSSWYD